MQEFRERRRGMVRQGEGKVVNNSQSAFGRMVNPLSRSRLTTWTSLFPILPQQDGGSRASRSVRVVPFYCVLIWLWCVHVSFPSWKLISVILEYSYMNACTTCQSMMCDHRSSLRAIKCLHFIARRLLHSPHEDCGECKSQRMKLEDSG